MKDLVPENWKKLIHYHYSEAERLASAVVEKKARAILRQHPNLDEFVMAMGGWFFTKKDKDATGYSMILHESSGDHCPKYMTGIRNFIDEWDDVLKTTGEPMRFTANGEKVTEWGAR